MRLLWRFARTVILLLLVALGTLALVRYAPGYFDDAREMDAQHAGSFRTEIESQRDADRSAAEMARAVALNWMHGRLGASRHYGVPVEELIRPRLFVTARLLAEAIALAWLGAFALALPLSARQGSAGEAWIVAASAVLLALPIGALATLFLLTNTGGPVLALGLILGARDFKFVYRLLCRSWRAPHLLLARAQGIGTRRLVTSHLLFPLLPQLASLASMSFVIALSAAVPAEVLFDVPGIGQLAWTAAMNRDLPLLLAVTLLMAAAVGCAGFFSEPQRFTQAREEAA